MGILSKGSITTGGGPSGGRTVRLLTRLRMSEVEEVVNETSGFISSKSGGGIGRKNLYEHWKDDYDDNPYDYPTWGYGLRYKYDEKSLGDKFVTGSGEKRRGIGGEDIMAVANDVPVAGCKTKTTINLHP
ncbi:alpha-1,4 glucan phosphorylase L isozyme, chloroplastic/amyloplastic isoform X2 [Tanacetum coccineum]|uniref:Alpha-1,4 glucan phosphorylase L isozyme, chloroplastic/amyloplastic isoform X2 n=1 Tax=Tanacetum coccineum TaxID=301880 RepID=A0ABQ4XCU1_9ASTR